MLSAIDTCKILEELADDLPALLGLLIAIILLLANRKRLGALIERASSVSIPGVLEVKVDNEAIKTARPTAPVSDKQAEALERRIDRNREVITGLRILWVDDTPKNNRKERQYLRSAGVEIVSARSTIEALDELQRYDFDIVITDLARHEPPEFRDKDHLNSHAGMDLVDAMRRAEHLQRVIAYNATPRPDLPTPAGMFGITTRPDELVNLVLDAIERPDESPVRLRSRRRFWRRRVVD